MLPARRRPRFTRGWASRLSGQSWCIAELARAAGLRFSRAAPALFGLGLVAAQLGHAGERTPRPTRQLAIAELLGDPDGVPQVLFRLVEPAQLAFRDPTRRPARQRSRCRDRTTAALPRGDRARPTPAPSGRRCWRR